MAHAGAAFWQYTYITGRDDENQVLFKESTWTDIIKPAADEAVQMVQSRPPVANCVPGESLRQDCQHCTTVVHGSNKLLLLVACMIAS